MRKGLYIGTTLLIIITVGTFYFTRDHSQSIISSQLPAINTPIVSTLAPIPTPTLPPSHLINTMFVPQAPENKWNEPWQDTCEEAALLTVYYYHNPAIVTTKEIKTALEQLIEYENNNGFGADISIEQMGLIAQKSLKLKPIIISDPTIEELKSYLSRDLPIIIPANGKILYLENHNFNNFGPYYHNIVLLGYDDTIQKFTVHDVGTRHGAYFIYSYQLLMDSIHDFPPDLHKENINNGPKKVLILEKML